MSDLKGKKIGLARGQTSDEYFKMVLRRAKMKYEEVTIENIWSQFGLAPALAEGKVDAVVSWEPYVTQVLTQVPDSYLVIRGGHHMSYVMVATAHGPTVESKPELAKRSPPALRSPRISPVKTATKRWRFSPNGCRAPMSPSARRRAAHFVSIRGCRRMCCAPSRMPRTRCCTNTLKGAARLGRAEPVPAEFMAEVEKEHPEYFGGLAGGAASKLRLIEEPREARHLGAMRPPHGSSPARFASPSPRGQKGLSILIACGLIGLPVAPVMISGGPQKKNS